MVERSHFPDVLAGSACTVRLTDDIDVEPLREELRSVERSPWDHQRPYSAGAVGSPIAQGWTCFPLRSPDGSLERTDPGGPSLLSFAETPALARMPAFGKLLRSIPGEVRAARLLALGPGAHLGEHRDEFIGFGYGQVRLHFPIVTNPGVALSMEGMEHHWSPGEQWYANFALPHSVRNDGTERRVHLVVDCMVNEKLLGLFPEWFQSRVRTLAYVNNPPPCEVSETPEVPAFRVPDAIAHDLLAHIPEEAADPRNGAPASVAVKNGVLVLRTSYGAECALVAVGPHEYRFEGWTCERTLSFDELPHRVILNDRRNFAHRTWSCPVLPGESS